MISFWLLFPSLSLLSTELSYAKEHLRTADGLKQQARLNPSKSEARAFFATLSTSRPNPAPASTAALMPLEHRGFPGSSAKSHFSSAGSCAASDAIQERSFQKNLAEGVACVGRRSKKPRSAISSAGKCMRTACLCTKTLNKIVITPRLGRS
jgi:hypothetical protein